MSFTLTSITGIALKTDSFERLTASTQDGVVTILPGHEAMVGALKPGLLTVSYEGKQKGFALGGGVIETDGTDVRILADMIEDGGHDLADIAERKKAALAQMEEYKQKGDPLSMEAYIELEQEYMKDIAREELARSQSL